MFRTIDHAGYYDTRIILAAISIIVAIYYYRAEGDARFLTMFVSGAFFTILMEYLLQSRGLRGPGYRFSLVGVTIPKGIGPMIQGILDGGIWSLFAFWFADLRSQHAKQRYWLPFYLLCLIVVTLAIFAGNAAQGQPITSRRPMFAAAIIAPITAIIFVSLVIAWRKEAFSELAKFYTGLLLFTFLTLEPLHITETRYIGIYSGLQAISAPNPYQIILMLLSHFFESAGSKIHCLMIPLACGLVYLKERDLSATNKRYSTQHLLDLTQRGWRKKSKPFFRE